MMQLGEALQEARIRELESRRWTYTRSGEWHSLSRLWRGEKLALSDDDLDRLLVRVEARQEDIEADLKRLQGQHDARPFPRAAACHIHKRSA